jgi:hypothetical protein
MQTCFSRFGSGLRFKTGVAIGFAFVIVIMASIPTYAIPAFARKYSLPCSACHEVWPKLNSFGQNFKDNGYQLMNDKDSPIYVNPGYWPVAMRTTPNWHYESNGNVPVDTTDGTVEQTINTSGFDLGGVDILAAGTLSKNISFLLVESIDSEDGSVGLEAANVRFDNLFNSPWLNFKFGKAELDLPLSEKRGMTLSNNGGELQLYHFLPVGDVTATNPADNQLGVELMGHCLTDRTRYALSVMSSNGGNPGLPAGRTYDMYFHLSHAFMAGNLGLQRVGVYIYRGSQPTYFLTYDGEDIPGTGEGNQSFYRLAFYGSLYVGRFDLTGVYQHASDNVYLGIGAAADGTQPLPEGAQDPAWNIGTFEAHFTYSPKLFILGRYEVVRMSQQALAENPSSLGNVDAVTIGYRFYPFINSRAGFAIHQEFSSVRSRLTSDAGADQRNSSFFTGLDFAF